MLSVPRTENLVRRRRLRRVTAWLTLALVVASVGCALLGRAYVSRHVYVSEGESAFAFTAVSGDRVVLGVRTDGGVSDLCAAEGGVQLWLSDDSDVIPVVPGRPRSWGSTIVSRDGDGCVLAGVFEVPDVGNGPRVTLDGTLKGTITYPAPYAGGFTNETRPLAVPVRITVVPRSGLLVWGGRPQLAVVHWVGIALATALLGLASSLLAFAFRWPPQGRPRTRHGWFGLLLGAAIFGGVAFFAALGVVLQGDASVESAQIPTTAPFMLLPLSVGAAAAAFGVRAALWLQDP